MKKSGFALIELIIVLIVVTIIYGVVMPSMRSSLSAVRLDSARMKLISDTLYAETLAVTQQVSHGVVFDPIAETYSVYRQTTSNIVKDPLTRRPFTVDYQSSAEYKGVGIGSTNFGSPTTNRVEFDSFGQPSDGAFALAADGTVTLDYGASTATVTVTKGTGKVG